VFSLFVPPSLFQFITVRNGFHGKGKRSGKMLAWGMYASIMPDLRSLLHKNRLRRFFAAAVFLQLQKTPAPP